MELADGGATEFSDYADATARSLTQSMILHPIACGLNFVAFMLALGAGTVGSLLASLVALVAFLTTAVATVIDFVLFSIVRSNVLDNGTGADAYYDAAAWTILVSAVCSLVGAVVVFFSWWVYFILFYFFTPFFPSLRSRAIRTVHGLTLLP